MGILGVAPDGQDYLSRFSPDDVSPYIVIIVTILSSSNKSIQDCNHLHDHHHHQHHSVFMMMVMMMMMMMVMITGKQAGGQNGLSRFHGS